MSTHLDFYLKCQQELLDKLDKPDSFFTQHDVSVKLLQKDNRSYRKFKYEDNCRFTYPWQMACRGTTIITQSLASQKKLTPVFSLNKFFNVHEIDKHYKMTFAELLTKLETEEYAFMYLPKHDGTCMQCFTDSAGIRHRITLGSLEKNTIGKSLQSYADTTELLLQQFYPELLTFLDENVGYSLICEILTPDNVIKTVYDFTKKEYERGILKPFVMIRPDGVPTFSGGCETTTGKVDNLNGDLTLTQLKLPTFSGGCETTTFWNLNIEDKWDFTPTNFEEVKEQAFAEMQLNPAKFGINPEGLVAYCYNNKSGICFPIAKLKRPEYFTFSVSAGIEELCKLQIHKLNGTIDDICLTEAQQRHIDDFSEYVDKTARQLEDLEFLRTFHTQRQYAAQVENLPKSLQIYKGSMYQIRKFGFEFVSGYDTIKRLLNSEIKGTKFIVSLQEEHGPTWFKKI